MFRQLMILVLLGAAWAAAATADDTPPPGPALADYLAWSAEHHPALAGERDRALALRDDAAKAGALPELRLAWGEMIVPVETRVGPQQRVLSVSQAFPWFGSLGLKGDAAADAADAADEGVRAKRLMVARDVRAAWYRLGALDAELDLARANAALADESAAWLRQAYAAGTATYAALLQGEMEASRLQVAVDDLADRRAPAVAALNAAAGLPAGTAAPAAALPDSLLLARVLPDDEAMAAAVGERNPELAALAAKQTSSRLGAEAAGKATGPNLSLGLDYIMTGEARMPGVDDSGKDPVIARVSVGIPLWGGASADSRAAAGRMRAAGEDLHDRRLQLAARLEQGLYAWRDAGRRLELQQTVLLPRARRLVEVATAAYAADQAAYGDLLAARRALLGLCTEQVRARLDRALALNDLALLVGVPVEDLSAALPTFAPSPEDRP